MTIVRLTILAAGLALSGCSGPDNSETENNQTTPTNNGTTGSNNQTSTNNGTAASNNQPTTTNNGTTGSNNQTTTTNNGTTTATNNNTSALNQDELCDKFCEALPTVCPAAFEDFADLDDCRATCKAEEVEMSDLEFLACQAEADSCDDLGVCKEMF